MSAAPQVKCPRCGSAIESPTEPGTHEVWCPACGITFDVEAEAAPRPMPPGPPAPAIDLRKLLAKSNPHTALSVQRQIRSTTAYRGLRSTAFWTQLWCVLFGAVCFGCSIPAVLLAPAAFVDLILTGFASITFGALACEAMRWMADIGDAHMNHIADRWNAEP